MRFRSQARFVAFQFDGVREASGHCSPVFWEFVNRSDQVDPKKTPDNAPIKWSTLCGEVARWVEIGDWIVEPVVPDLTGPSQDIATAGRRVMSDAAFRKEFQVCDDPISKPLARVLSQTRGIVRAIELQEAGEPLRASEDYRGYAHRLGIALADLDAAVAPLKMFAEAGEQSAADRDNAEADSQAFANQLGACPGGGGSINRAVTDVALETGSPVAPSSEPVR